MAQSDAGSVDPNYVESTENSSSEVEECNIVDNEDVSFKCILLRFFKQTFFCIFFFLAIMKFFFACED